MTGTFRVLHVCTGNICRSPMAERLMRAGIEQRLGMHATVEVTSAGTMAHAGAGMERDALETLQGYGVDGSDFRARELLLEHVASADLVLGATREHRAAAVVLQPRAAARTFTLRQFARLVETVDPGELPAGDLAERGRALVRAAAGQRGRGVLVTPADDDLTDPYRGPAAGFRACAELEHRLLQHPLDLLCGTGAGASGT